MSNSPLQTVKTEISGIQKTLEEIVSYSHRKPSEVFEDWVMICEAELRMMPKNLLSQAQCGSFAQDSEETLQTYQRLAKRYSVEQFKLFHQASHQLWNAIEQQERLGEYEDFLGPMYMIWGRPNDSLGQFFTPTDVCELLAQLTVHGERVESDIEEELLRRLQSAIDNSPMNAILNLTVTDANAESVAREYVFPYCREYFEPITVYDPTVGSGGILLSVASQCPRWALNYGAVQFFGQEIDPLCTKMSRINCMLYGLDGWRMELQYATQTAHNLLNAKTRGITKTSDDTTAPDNTPLTPTQLQFQFP